MNNVCEHTAGSSQASFGKANQRDNELFGYGPDQGGPMI